jgi:glyoxylase-like metal-dependent hydrolase (beta-lactamase superfamily II)
MIEVFRFITSPIETNTWLVCNDNHDGLIIDPGSGCDEVLDKIKKSGISCGAIILTHSHFDHISGIPELQEALGPLPVYIHPEEASFLGNARLNISHWFGDEFSYNGATEPLAEGPITIDGICGEIRHVPGHSPGSCALIMDSYCLSGDALFAGSIGRHDLPGGNGPQLITSITTKLLTLPDSTTVCPGHGGRTTIGREKKTNPFLV